MTSTCSRTMAPRRTRRKTVAVADAESDLAVTPSDCINHDNSKGFPTFPYELHMEILSYFLSVPIPCMDIGILPAEYRDKFDAIFALSQLCRTLRHMYHPLLWQSMEACALRSGRAKNKAMATELVQQAEIVTVREPELAQSVRSVNSYLRMSRTETFNFVPTESSLLRSQHSPLRMSTRNSHVAYRASQTCTPSR